MTNVKCGFTMTALSSLISSMKPCKIQAVPGCPKCEFFYFSDSFFSEQLNLEDQNRFISLAKDSETITPSTGTKISLSVD